MSGTFPAAITREGERGNVEKAKTSRSENATAPPLVGQTATSPKLESNRPPGGWQEKPDEAAGFRDRINPLFAVGFLRRFFSAGEFSADFLDPGCFGGEGVDFGEFSFDGAGVLGAQ